MDLDVGCISGVRHLVESPLLGARQNTDTFVRLDTVSYEAGGKGFLNGTATVFS